MSQAVSMRGRRSRLARSGLTLARGVAAALLELAAFCGSWAYSTWRLGTVELTNDGAPLKVEVLHESRDETIGEPVELVRRATLQLPDGDYRFRVTGEGRLSRTFRFAVHRGETLARSMTLDEGRLLDEVPTPPTPSIGFFSGPTAREPIPYHPDTVAIELTPGKADLVEWSNGRLVRRDGATGQVLWNALEPRKPGQPQRDYHPWIIWLEGHSAGINPIEPAPDLDGDGTRDLVWATECAFLALSGKDGSVLWTHLAELDGPGGAYPEGPDLPGPIRPATRPGQVLVTPALVDVDRDSVPDLIANLVFGEFPAEIARGSFGSAGSALGLPRNRFRRVVQAISGRSGRLIWSHAIDPSFSTINQGIGNPPATLVQGRKTLLLAMLEGRLWRSLDPATGRPRPGAIDLGFRPVRPVRYVDLDGDGEPEILATGPGPAGKTQSLSAFSIATGRPLWTATINALHAIPYVGSTPEWPLVVELDGDGRAEIVVPHSGPLDASNGYRGARMLDGPTGRPRWTRPMRPDTKADDGLIHIVEAPDLDGDGTGDLVTASIFIGRRPATANQRGPAEPERIYLDALSGKDGRPLWWWHIATPTDRSPVVSTPLWWGRGPDGWPLLTVLITNGFPEQRNGNRPPSDALPSTVHVLEASTGRVVHSVVGLEPARVADLNGDGLPDLWGAFQNTLRAFAGQAPEAWRALEPLAPARDSFRQGRDEDHPGADLDGDGIGDALMVGVQAPVDSPDRPGRAIGSRIALVRSGRDGHLLWKADLGVRRRWFERDLGGNYALSSFPTPAGDLDGDGAADVAVLENAQQPPARANTGPATLPLLVLSGRTGRPLWIAGPLPLEFEAHGFAPVQWLESRIVEPNSPPDLIVCHGSPVSTVSMPTTLGPNSNTLLWGAWPGSRAGPAASSGTFPWKSIPRSSRSVPDRLPDSATSTATVTSTSST